MVNIFKFATLGSAKFVTERLSQMGLKAAYMPSGYIRVEEMTEEAETLIKESLGTHVAATGVEDLNLPKYAGTGRGKKKLAPKVEDPKSPPTANSKTLKKYGSTSDSQTKGDVEEAYYSKAAATAMHIPAKWVYDEFFKLIKDSGAMFNRLKAESTLEYIFGLMHNPKSPYSKYQGTDVLLSSALIEYKKIMGIREAAEKPAEPTKPEPKAEPKTPEEPKISPEGQKMLNVQKMAYETLKRLVERSPKSFPRLAKIMGIKVKE